MNFCPSVLPLVPRAIPDIKFMSRWSNWITTSMLESTKWLPDTYQVSLGASKTVEFVLY